jgi:hypothetical protein
MNETVVLLLMALTMLIAGMAGLRERPEARRRPDIARWARENFITLTPAIADQLDRARTRRRRATAWSAVAMAPVMALASIGADAAVVWLAVLGAAVVAEAVATAQLERPWEVALEGTRTARVRRVSLYDYVPRTLRGCGWFAGAAALASALLSPGIEDRGRHGAVALLVVAALVQAEWRGRRLAALPEPAREPAELYAQDVWRAELAQSGFRGITVCAALVMTSPGFTAAADPHMRGVFFGVGLALMVAAVVSTRFSTRPAGRVRQRLWPDLDANEVVRATPAAVGP